VNLSHEGLSLWYGTPDAPAPGDDGVVPRRGASLVVAVHPANPTNSVLVRYRVDGGREQTIPGRELRTDYKRQAQYFGVTFPEFTSGKVVEYVPVFGSGGRQVPGPQFVNRYPSKFLLAPAVVPARVALAPAMPPSSAVGGGQARHFGAGLDFVASVAVRFSSPEYVGDTPAGMRVNFFVEEGVVEGQGFKATVAGKSSDHLIVRRDGMGMVRVHAAFLTLDGASLDVEAGGYVDFGPDGYRRALSQDLPDCAPLVITPLISTRHPRYRWLGRLQCLAVGYTNLDANRASYRVYAVSSQAQK
jgi:hypothetical protein